MILLKVQECNFIKQIAKISTHIYNNIFQKNLGGGGWGVGGRWWHSLGPTLAPSMIRVYLISAIWYGFGLYLALHCVVRVSQNPHYTLV